MKETTTDNTTCFVLMPFGSELVNLWDAVISSAIREAGLTPLRGEDLTMGGNLMQQVRHHILSSRVVVAVISGANPNVMYELGLAHAAKKQVILFQERGGEKPNAFSHMQLLEYDPRDFPQSRKMLVRALINALQNRQGDDLFPELVIPGPGIMEEYRYLRQIRKTLTVRVVPEYCSIFLNNRYMGRSPQILSINPDADRNILSISAPQHFEYYQEISATDLDKDFFEIELEPRKSEKLPERVHSWLMQRRKDPDSPVLSSAIFNYLLDQKMFDQAREEALFLIAKAPQWFNSYNNMGFLEWALGEYKIAKKHFQMAVELDRDGFLGWYYLVCMESIDGNLDEAVNILKKIIDTPTLSESFRQICSRVGIDLLMTEPDFENLKNSPLHQKVFASLAKQFEELGRSNPPALISHPMPEVEENKGLPNLPFTLKHFEIRDFQCIKNTGLDNLPPSAPWIIITGDNGDGKTSLLQALAICLHGEEDAESLLKTNLSTRLGMEIRHGDTVLVHDFYRRDGYWRLENNEGKKGVPFVNLIAYGPSRLDISPESTKATEEAERSPVYSLLQQRGNLRNVEHWLKMRFLEQNEHGQERARRVQQVLVALMPNVSRMELVGSEFKYTENGQKVPWSHLSSGQKNLLNMVGDLLIRLYEFQPHVVDPKELQGMVLIDELDVHLHPNRQKELPGQLSLLFPNVQFIATTHSVIPVMGVPEGSVFLRVIRDPLQGTKVEWLDIETANLLPNAILSSPLFNMKSILAKQNKSFADLHTEDDYEDVKRKKRVDEALDRLGELFPADFLKTGE